jgi:hypothetical protein
LKTGYNPTWQAATALSTAGDPDGYAAYATAGISFLTGEPNGASAWNFVKQNFLQVNTAINDNPKWTLLPRTGGATPPAITPPGPIPPVTTSKCDVNLDGVVDSTDMAAAVNQALGISACSSADIDGNGTCNIVDVQRVINALTTGTCRVGP